MKILMINAFYPPNTIGGAEVFLHQISKKLSENNEIEILTQDKKIEKELEQKIKVHRLIHAYENILFRDIYNPKIPNFNFEKYDIIHLHNIHRFSLRIFKFLKSAKKPIVWTFHDYWLFCPRYNFLNGNNEICNENCMHCTKRIYKNVVYFLRNKYFENNFKEIDKLISFYIAPSNFMKRKLLNFGIKQEKVILLHNGIDLKKWNFCKTENSNIILFIGRISEEKGLSYLINAIPLILKEKNVILNIVGDGAEKEKMIKLVKKLNLQSNIKFFEKTNMPEEYYKKCSIVVIPSICEDIFPNVGLESLAIGRAIVGSKLGGIVDLIEEGKNGYLVSPRSPEDIAEKILKILKENKFVDFAWHSREIAEKKFELNSYIKNLTKIYEDAICQFKH